METEQSKVDVRRIGGAGRVHCSGTRSYGRKEPVVPLHAVIDGIDASMSKQYGIDHVHVVPECKDASETIEQTEQTGILSLDWSD
jgi:hypothetical protein